jgi:hypothetical protein
MFDIHNILENGLIYIVRCKKGKGLALLDLLEIINLEQFQLHLKMQTDPVSETLFVSNIPHSVDNVQPNILITNWSLPQMFKESEVLDVSELHSIVACRGMGFSSNVAVSG